MALSRPFRTRAQFANQHLDRRAGRPLDVITDLVGIYSTSPTSHLSLIARVDGFRPADLDALAAQKAVVRMGAMRGSGYYVPVALVPTIFGATAARRKSVYNEIVGKIMDRRTYERLATKIEKIIAGTELTTAQIRAEVNDAKYAEHLRHVVRLMTTECRLIPTRTSGTWRSNLIYLRSWSEWLPEIDPNGVATDEAQVDLARLYFEAHAPATVADFAWWSGLGKAATEIVARAEIPQIDDEYLGLVTDVKQPRGVRLLPIWDGLFLSHKDRSHALPDALYGHVYDPSGNPTSVVTVDGRAAGQWDLTVTKEHHVVKVAPFDSFSDPTKRRIEREVDRLATALGAPDVKLKWIKKADSLGTEWNRFMSPLKDR